MHRLWTLCRAPRSTWSEFVTRSSLPSPNDRSATPHTRPCSEYVQVQLAGLTGHARDTEGLYAGDKKVSRQYCLRRNIFQVSNNSVFLCVVVQGISNDLKTYYLEVQLHNRNGGQIRLDVSPRSDAPPYHPAPHVLLFQCTSVALSSFTAETWAREAGGLHGNVLPGVHVPHNYFPDHPRPRQRHTYTHTHTHTHT